MPVERRTNAIAPPVAIIVFDGMQSHRWAAPPMTSRSTIVTSAPKRWAYVAAVLPAGPPPMITKRVDTTSRLDGRQGHLGRADAEAVPSLSMVDEAPDAAGPLTGSGLAAERARRQAQVDAIRDAGGEPYPLPLRSLAHARASCGPQWPDARAGHGDRPTRSASPGGSSSSATPASSCSPRSPTAAREIQLFVSKAVIGDDGFAAVKELDLGDWVGVHGTVMTTREGELSVKVDRLVLLAKSLRPLPEKWHGLSDPDTRFRQRYVDLIVNAEARRAFDIRHEVIASFRRTLHERGFIEVETPVLHVEAGGAHARPFVAHYNALDMPLYLRIALELHLKRLIVGGMDRVFEIGRVFRNEGLSPRHNPEFTMMELVPGLRRRQRRDGPHRGARSSTRPRDALGTTVVTIRGQEVDLAVPWPKRRMVDLVSEAIGREVHPSQSVDDLRKLAEDHGVRWEPQWGGGKLVEELFEATVEPHDRRADVRHRPPGRDLPAGPRRSHRPVAHRALRAVLRLARARQRLQRAQRPGRAARPLRGRAGGARTPATSRPAPSTRTTCARSSTACRRPVASASASTAS